MIVVTIVRNVHGGKNICVGGWVVARVKRSCRYPLRGEIEFVLEAVHGAELFFPTEEIAIEACQKLLNNQAI